MRNQQVLIDSLPQGKLSASNYRLAESEIAPPAFRGSLVTLAEVSLSIGILLAYVVNFFLSGVSNQWRCAHAPPADPRPGPHNRRSASAARVAAAGG